MGNIQLEARVREATGKGAVKKMRREGVIPGVLYGPKRKETVSLSFNYDDLKGLLVGGEHNNVLLDVNIKDKESAEGSKVQAVFKEVQRNHVSGEVLHLDLYEIVKGQKMHVHVPIHISGKPEGVVAGGIVQYEVRELEVECLPRDIPTSFEVDITPLNIGDALHVRDVSVGEGVKVLTDSDATVISVVPPAKEEVVEKTAEEVEEELAESFEKKEETEEVKEGES